jgi:hypothetical protein
LCVKNACRRRGDSCAAGCQQKDEQKSKIKDFFHVVFSKKF